MRQARGFTLIEVMVALFVIALGVGALLTTLVGSADTVGYLREKSFAQWIALNRLAELRLAGGRPEPGITHDTVEYAGSTWRYEQQISEAGIGSLLRVDVRVARADGDDGDAAQEDEFAPLGSAIGFLGATPMRASGLTPDWGQRPPGGPGQGGDGGGDGDGEGDGDGGAGAGGDGAGEGGGGAGPGAEP